jgi:hypothetical protein
LYTRWPAIKHIRKLRNAAAAALARPIEGLEARCYLSVSTDANGWTVVTPSADSRVIYVSSSSGSDSNSGLSPDQAVKTITKGQSLMRGGIPDQMLLKRGDTFSTNIFISKNGRSADEPSVLANYGDPTVPRPIVDSGTSIGLNFGSPTKFIDVIGINFTSSTHDPTSPNFINKGSFGIQDLGTTDTVLIEDCRFQYFTQGANFQGSATTPVSNITFRRNEVLDSYTTNGNAQGLYAEQVNGLTLQENVFDHNGWSTLVPGATASQFSQDVYLHSSDNNVVATGNVFANAASTGMEARAGGIVDNNIFIADPTGLTFGLVNGSTAKAGGVVGEVIGNVFLKSRDISGTPVGLGADLGNLKPGGNVVMANNLFEEDTQGVNAAITFEPGVGVNNPTQEVGVNTLTVQNNIVRSWAYGMLVSGSLVPGGTGQTALNGLVVRNNDFQGMLKTKIIDQLPVYDPRYEDWSGNRYNTSAPQSGWFNLQGSLVSYSTWQSRIEPNASATAVSYVDGTRDLESYMASLGMTASVDAYLNVVRNQSKSNWDTRFSATTTNAYIEAGYVTDTIAPTPALAPAPDVVSDSTPTKTFNVTYTDNYSVNASTIANGNLIVTGPNGFSQAATLVSSSGGNGSTINATYSITAPGNTWASLANGTYVIALASGQVKDISGNAIVGQNLGSFQLTLGSPIQPAGPATTPLGLAASPQFNGISITWSDPAADQSSFRLQRADDSGFSANVQTTPIIASATSYLDTTATLGKQYFYQLIAVNSTGASAPTATASTRILPSAPLLQNVIFDDGNAARTPVTAITLVFSQQVTMDGSMVSLLFHGTSNAVNTTVANPTGDGKTWVLNFTGTGGINGTLGDGNYDLNIFNSRITDAFGQNAGSDQIRNFSVDVAPRVTAQVFSDSAPPHSLSFTFSKDVSASLSVSTLSITNGSTSYPPVSFSWNAATLTGTWTYSGAFPDNANAYTAKLPQTLVHDVGGVHLDGNGDGIPGDDHSFTFKQTKPTITLSGSTPVLNSPYTVTYGTVSDPGQTVSQYLIHWGDGNTDTFTTTGQATHTYSATGSYTISTDIVDANGTHLNSGSLAVTVVRALVTLSGNANANPTGLYTLSLNNVTDVGQTPSGYIVHWGDSTSTTFSGSGPFTHTYATTATGSKAITVDLIDGQGTVTGAGKFSVTVNSLPSISLTGNTNTNIGGTYRLVLGSPTDTGYTVTNYLIHWGDGTTTSSGAIGTFTHTYSATGAKQIAVDLTDSVGTYTSSGKLSITVNPPPTIVLSGSSNDLQGDQYALTLGTVTDPGQSVSQYIVHWGDGSSNVYTARGIVTHSFSSFGTMNITVDLVDGTGTYTNAGSKSVSVTQSQAVTLTGNPTNDNFYVKLDLDGHSVDVWANNANPGGGTPDFVFSNLSSLTIAANGGNDTFTLDETGGVINLSGGITFNGGSASSQLTVVGTSGADTLSTTNTSMVFNGGQIYWLNLAAINYNDGNGNDTINVGGTAPFAVNVGTGNDTFNLATNATATINLNNATGDVTINGNGSVIINIGSADPNFSMNSTAITLPAAMASTPGVIAPISTTTSTSKHKTPPSKPLVRVVPISMERAGKTVVFTTSKK